MALLFGAFVAVALATNVRDLLHHVVQLLREFVILLAAMALLLLLLLGHRGSEGPLLMMVLKITVQEMARVQGDIYKSSYEATDEGHELHTMGFKASTFDCSETDVALRTPVRSCMSEPCAKFTHQAGL